MYKQLTVNLIHHVTSCKIQTIKRVLKKKKKKRNQVVNLTVFLDGSIFYENSFPKGNKSSNNVRCFTKDGLLAAPVGWRSGVKPLYAGTVWKTTTAVRGNKENTELT